MLVKMTLNPIVSEVRGNFLQTLFLNVGKNHGRQLTEDEGEIENKMLYFRNEN